MTPHALLEKIWWFLTKWIAPVGPVVIHSKNMPFPYGHHYWFVGMAFAVRKKEP